MSTRRPFCVGRAHARTAVLALAAMVALVWAAGCDKAPGPNAVPAERPSDAASAGGVASAPAATAPLAGPRSVEPARPLSVEPVSGFVGDKFRVSVGGLPAGAAVDWQWVTLHGTYETQVSGHDVLFMQRRYKEQRRSLGRSTADGRGSVEATLTAPEDYGEVHDLYAVVDGSDVARGGYRIVRRATISPSDGPIGTPITVEVTGLAWRAFESTMALRYDNAYTGFVSAVTTSGAARFRVRAAGPAGRHVLQLTAASPGVPFLNNQQSGTAHIDNMDLRLPFTVTADAGPPAASTEWPSADRLAAVGRDGVPSAHVAAGISATLHPTSGDVGAEFSLAATGLPPSSGVQVVWKRAGEDEAAVPKVFREAGAVLVKATTTQDGSLVVPLRAAGERGGWHMVTVMVEGSVRAEIPFYVRRSLQDLSPRRVRSGEQFTIELKGGGWTELDKGVAVTYDNSYIGYACSVTSGGDITIHLVATGEPGTHLVDLYPMLYRHPGDHPAEYWNFELPQLTALDDHPGLALGYQLPIFRLAVEVTD